MPYKKGDNIGDSNPAKRLDVRRKISEKIKKSWKNPERKKRMKELKLLERNPNWSGDDVTYSGIHMWVRRNKIKPLYCEKCNLNVPYELANISGKYKRDLNDFKWLCRSCHSKEHRGKEWHNYMLFKRYNKNGGV